MLIPQAELDRRQRLELSRAAAEVTPFSWGTFTPTASAGGASGAPAAGASPSGGPRRRARRLRSCHHDKSHREESCTVEFAENARFIRVKIPGNSIGKRGDRVAINQFTAKSRKALLDRLNMIDQTAAPADRWRVVTLTYPDAFPSARASKKHLDDVLKRFFRKFGDVGTFWKLEPQRRGAPHYHLLLLMPTAGDVATEINWWADNWAEVVNSGDPAHRLWHLGLLGNGNQPCVEVPRSWNGVTSYAAKYLGKLTDTQAEHFDNPGRFWGIRHAGQLPRSIIKLSVSPEQAIKIKRHIRQWSEKQPSNRYYIPGIVRNSGKHSPGQIVYGDQLWTVGTSTRPRPFRHVVEEVAQLLGRKIREQRRYCRRGMGGISAYLSAQTGEKLIAWVTGLGRTAPPPCDVPF